MLNKFCSILNFQFLPVQNPPGGLEYRNLEAESKIFFKIGKLHPKRKLFCQITYPLSPKTKPIITVYAKVSELPPPFNIENNMVGPDIWPTFDIRQFTGYPASKISRISCNRIVLISGIRPDIENDRISGPTLIYIHLIRLFKLQQG